MKLLLLSLLVCNIAYSQWSPVKTFNTMGTLTVIKDLDFSSEQNGFLISASNGGSHSSFYRTTDGGITWNSLTTLSHSYYCINVVSDQIIYAAGILYNTNNNQNFYICRSLDGGQTWFEYEILNTFGELSKTCLAFQNDSTGVLSSPSGMYYTNDYGTNWTLFSNTTGKFAVNLGSGVASLYNNNVYLTDVNTLSVQTNYLDCYGVGDVVFASSYGDTLIRNTWCNDGAGGIMFNSLTISELGGNTKVIHFMENQIGTVAVNASGIYATSGRPLRSMDGGQSFFKQDCTLPCDSILHFFKLDFIDGDIAYALALNLDSGFVKLLKTTNAGGITTNYITQPLQNVGLTNDADEPSLQVYPNPAINELNIESSSLMDQLEICDLTGRSLAKYTGIQSTHFEVDCRFLHSGNYLVKVSSEGKTVVRQVRVL